MSTTIGIDDLCINTIRFLAVDAVEKAKSGHPGAPMGAAPLAYVLWTKHLKHAPQNPSWVNRDRFILSAGHASMLLYSLLHLTGYDLSLEDLKNFRQWGSKTPGHPEIGVTPGVETTTGPLGQGFANGVGMALAERWLSERYNKKGHEIINHYTYTIVSDGDLEEGISSEAASFAGANGLGKLIYLYDSNGISIEGNVSSTFNEDVASRFISYGWQVIGPIDGTNLEIIDAALNDAKAETQKPSLIVCTTTIGHGSPNKSGTADSHGSPLGSEEVVATKKALGWQHSEPFTVPGPVFAHMRRSEERGASEFLKWEKAFSRYQKAFPVESKQMLIDLSGDLPEGWDAPLHKLFNDEGSKGKSIATRVASGMSLNALAETIHNLIGGSADLAPSNNSMIKSRGDFGFDSPNINLQFGVREHSMGSIANGMAVHGGVIPYTATFLVFYDYMRPAVRLAALMRKRVVFIFTHDSIFLGEDGPTHQPIEHLMSARLVPNLSLIRPADATETAEAWKVAISQREKPVILALSRQALPVLDRNSYPPASNLAYGAYTIWQSSSDPEIIVLATGSELHIAIDGAKQAAEKGIPVRVVSMPSWDLFELQSESYKESVLPARIGKRISVEAGVTLGWERYIGSKGISLGIDHYGASAPGSVLGKEFGLTSEAVLNAVLSFT